MRDFKQIVPLNVIDKVEYRAEIKQPKVDIDELKLFIWHYQKLLTVIASNANDLDDTEANDYYAALDVLLYMRNKYEVLASLRQDEKDAYNKINSLKKFVSNSDCGLTEGKEIISSQYDLYNDCKEKREELQKELEQLKSTLVL